MAHKLEIPEKSMVLVRDSIASHHGDNISKDLWVVVKWDLLDETKVYYQVRNHSLLFHETESFVDAIGTYNSIEEDKYENNYRRF